ncbi:gliding motility-associated C-terminal domain-containing protein, partial [Cellulophaga sp. E16_2]|uniref:T9SS type B sorting domain-containing protein n=1 Tax=Cellulophaga sp. E16_2 TaxID=2789297 RepID=UPI001A93563F
VVVINDGGTPDDISDDTITYTPNDGFTGEDDFEYTICDTLGNCDTGTVTITVAAYDVIDAVDDIYETTTSGGTLEGNILDNDLLNGEQVSISEVEITSTPTGPLMVNTDGTVTVDTDTAPGTYTIAYTICEIAVPTNCDTATVTVIIENDYQKIEVNQMVTPNGDGKNDFLFIRNVEFALNNTLKIFNRWGISVYEGEGYNNQNNVFDGRSRGRSTFSKDEYLPSGVYFYIFDYQDVNGKAITDSAYIYISK